MFISFYYMNRNSFELNLEVPHIHLLCNNNFLLFLYTKSVIKKLNNTCILLEKFNLFTQDAFQGSFVLISSRRKRRTINKGNVSENI